MRLQNCKLWMSAVFMLVFTSLAFSQAIVTGSVQDADSMPISGAEVSVGGTDKTTVTDDNGAFRIEVEAGEGTVEIFDAVNGSREMTYSVKDGDNFDLGMISLDGGDGVSLEEIVVVGKGVIDISTGRNTPVANTVIMKEEIQSKAAGNVEFPEVMKNVPAVYISGQDGYGDSRMFMRGFDQTNTAFLLNGQPINGMEDGKMYWSNWAGMADIANAVDVQRGLGASKLAISSVGGTVNIVSKATEKKQGGFARFMTGNDSYFKGTFSYDTGISSSGWGFSIMLDHWQAQKKGGVNGTKGQGQNYFLSVGKKAGKHNFNFLIFGAPQWHMQNWSKSEALLAADRDYNQHWGFDQGDMMSERTNFYHKPVMNLNWDFEISDMTSVSAVLYGSFGRGGGTGPRGNGRKRFDDYTLNGYTFDGQIDYDAIRENNALVGVGGDYSAANGAGYIRRASMNNHVWYGGVANFNHRFNENLLINVGADLRFYTGDHFRQIANLYGLSGWGNDRPDDAVVSSTFDINPWSTFFSFADEDERIAYDFSEDINYQGVFGQVEYSQDAFSVFFQGAVSNQSYQRENRFATDSNGNMMTETSESTSKIGYNLKGGAAYNFNENHTIFANAGFYSRQPFLDNIFSGTTTLASPEVDNEEITGLEAGYKFSNKDMAFSLNVYRTEWANRFISYSNTIKEIATGNGIDITREQPDVTQIHQGIEAEYNYRLNKKFKLGIFMSYGNWEYASSTPVRTRNQSDNTYLSNADVNLYTDEDGNPISFFEGEANLDGVKVADAPQFQFGANVKYQVVKGWNVGLDLNVNGKMYYFVDVEDVIKAQEDDEVYENKKMNNFATLDFNTSYKLKFGKQAVTLRANVYNLLNNSYISYSDAYGSKMGLRRTWNASVSFNF